MYSAPGFDGLQQSGGGNPKGDYTLVYAQATLPRHRATTRAKVYAVDQHPHHHHHHGYSGGALHGTMPRTAAYIINRGGSGSGGGSRPTSGVYGSGPDLYRTVETSGPHHRTYSIHGTLPRNAVYAISNGNAHHGSIPSVNLTPHGTISRASAHGTISRAAAHGTLSRASAHGTIMHASLPRDVAKSYGVKRGNRQIYSIHATMPRSAAKVFAANNNNGTLASRKSGKVYTRTPEATPKFKKSSRPHSVISTLSRAATREQERVDVPISNFQIQFDQANGTYKPGDELSGKVIMDVWSPIEIKFVELVIVGKGTVRVFKEDGNFSKKPRSELYLDQKILLIAPSDSSPSIILSQGHYVTTFRYRLPEDLPPTVNQFETNKGQVFDISYTVQAHVCNAFKLHGGALPDVAKVLKNVRRNFTIAMLPHFSPGTQEPMMHAEQVRLYQFPCGVDATSVLVHLDKSEYPRGENIRIQVEVLSKKRSKVKEVGVELQQDVAVNYGKVRKHHHVLMKAFDNLRNQTHVQPANMVQSSFSLPVPTNIVPSDIGSCTIVVVHYTVQVVVQFKGISGKMTVRMPITIAPEGKRGGPVMDEPIDRPLFNKPIMKFPYFSKSLNDLDDDDTPVPPGDQHSTISKKSSLKLNGFAHAGDRSSIASRSSVKGKDSRGVTSSHKMCTKCCDCWSACFGLGIYNDS